MTAQPKAERNDPAKPLDARKACEAFLAAMKLDAAGKETDDLEGHWARCLRPWPKKGWRGVEVASYRCKDTSRSLYRLLFLSKPKSLDFSDMYKTGAGFIALVSACERFAVRFELWKFELAFRFYVLERFATRHSGPHVCTSNAPTTERGVVMNDAEMRTLDDDALLFIEMVEKSLARKWAVYGGNNFDV